jgi:hypothetical protein
VILSKQKQNSSNKTTTNQGEKMNDDVPAEGAVTQNIIQAANNLKKEIDMTVRAKFRVISKNPSGNGSLIKLAPVTADSPENKTFYEYTPFGIIELGTVNEKAAEHFEIDKEYYVDFTETK